MSDYISRADAIEAVCDKCPISFKEKCEWKDNGHCSMKVALEALPSADAEQVTSKLKKPCDSLLTDESCECKEHKSNLESANAEPTVIRSKTLLPTKDFKEWAKRIREVNPNAVVIPCDAEVVSADAVQGEWVRKEREYNDCDGYYAHYWYECSVCGARPPKDQWKNEWHSNYCPNCGARMKGGDNK